MFARVSKSWKTLQIEGPHNSQFLDNDFFLLINMWYDHSFARMYLLIGTVCTVSDVSHGPLVIECIIL